MNKLLNSLTAFTGLYRWYFCFFGYSKNPNWFCKSFPELSFLAQLVKKLEVRTLYNPNRQEVVKQERQWFLGVKLNICSYQFAEFAWEVKGDFLKVAWLIDYWKDWWFLKNQILCNSKLWFWPPRSKLTSEVLKLLRQKQG